MPTLVATAGSASANSYVTEADADTYFGERLNVSAWDGASTDDRERALIMASRRLDQERYQGEKTATGQALEWPRTDALDKDGEEYGTSTIPQIVEDATCEMALVLLNANAEGTDTLADSGLEQFKSAKVGELAVEKDQTYEAGQLPQNVKRILSHVLRTSRMSGTLLPTGNSSGHGYL